MSQKFILYCYIIIIVSIIIIISHSGCVESSGQMEWKLQLVVDNTQLGSPERVVEKMRHTIYHKLPVVEQARKEAEGERDKAMVGKQQAEGERDKAMVGKQQAEGERDREMVGKQQAEGERDRAMVGKQQTEGERDRAMVEKQQAEGERDRAMAGKQQAERERDRAMVGKQRTEGERDRAMAGKQQAERERDRAMAGKQQAERARDRAMVGKQQTEGERDRAMVGKQQAEGERDRAVAGKQQVEGERDRAIADIEQVEGERDRAMVGKQEAEEERDILRGEKQQVEEERDRAPERAQQAETRANDLQRRLDEVEGREHESLVVQEQAIAAEQRGPSWEVKEEDLQATGDVIGIGGWAEVKVAHLKVAAKYLHSQPMYDYHHQLFRREMDVAARVSHPNLLRFLGAKLQGGMAILTELMPTSLRSEVNRGYRNPEHRLSREHIISIATDVACALNYLHHMTPDPIIHRDLSSANVLLQPTPNGGWLAKVSDYGSANFQKQLQTKNPGSPVYASPESDEPSLQSPKMDIYSFGVLLVEMCTCQFPVPERRAELIDTIEQPRLVQLIRQCLNTDRERRPTAAQLVDLLHSMQ